MTERQHFSSGSPWEDRFGYCRAVRVGDRVLVSGTAPVWPDGSCDPDPGAQARRCLEIILTAIGEAGGGREHVVRTRMFVTDISLWQEFGKAHAEFFAECPPATSMYEISSLVDPEMLIEIEADAFVGENTD